MSELEPSLAAELARLALRHNLPLAPRRVALTFWRTPEGNWELTELVRWRRG